MTRDEIVHYFKQRIGNGGFAPCSPLPVRKELLRVCEASNVTVQRALNILIEEGFIRSRGSRGLEVAAHPPCTCRFGVILPPDHGRGEPNYDTRLLSFSDAAKKLEKSGISFEFYTISPFLDGEDEKRLFSDLKASRIAGAIALTSLPEQLIRPLEGFPLVLMQQFRPELFHAVYLNYDYVKWTKLALGRMKEAGAKKTALLLPLELNRDFVEAIYRLADESGIVPDPDRHLVGISHSPRGSLWTKPLVRLLFASPGDTPDGLIIQNENVLPYVLEVLEELGLRPGRDIRVCCHCNLPSRDLREDILYVGFNSTRILTFAVECIRRFAISGGEIFTRELLTEPEIVKDSQKKRCTVPLAGFARPEHINAKQ